MGLMDIPGKILITIVLTSLVVVSGLAIPTIKVVSQELGSGNAPVCSPEIYGGFYFLVGPSLVIEGIKVMFSRDLPPNTIVFARIASKNGNTSVGSVNVGPSGLKANTPLIVQVNGSITYYNVSTVSVTLQGGNSTSQTGRISLTVQGLGISLWNASRPTIYAQPINITYNGTTELQNWPVKVVLEDNGYGDYYINWTALASNPDSIRFLDSSGRLLNYWIEILDPIDMYAVIWVNVTVPPGGTKIWMLYGDNGNYSSYNDGHKVFPFFDDFEVWSGWTQYRSGIVQQVSDDFEYGGSYAAEKTGYNDPNGAYKSLGRIFYRNNTYGGLILEYWDQRVQDTGGNLDRVGMINDSGYGYGAVLNTINHYIQIDVRKAYRGFRNALVRNGYIVTNTWYRVRFEILANGSLVMKVYDYWGDLIASTSYTDTSYNEFTRVYIFGGQTYHIDALRVMYYTPDEPQAVVDEWYRYLPFTPSCS